MIQLVKAGVLDIAKVSASSMEQFNSAYAIFSMPYVFESTEQYFAVMNQSEAVQEIFKSTYDQGFFAWVLWLVVHLRSILGVKNKVMVMLNWLWKYVSYNDSIRMITYATKPKEVRDRLKREQTTHLGTDLLENEEEEEEA